MVRIGKMCGALALALLVAAATSARAAESFTFRYAPPPDTRWILVLDHSQLLELAGRARQSSEIESRTRFAVTPDEDGYRVTSKPLSVRMTRDGRTVEDPVLQALRDVVTVHRLDSAGRLVAVEGYEGLAERLRARFPEQVTQALAGALDEQALAAQERAEWEGRIGGLLGRTVSLGEVLRGKTRLRVAGREISCDVETRITERVACGASQCLRVKSVYRDQAPEQLLAGGLRVSGETERLIDPDTMLIYAESMARITETQVEQPDQGAVRAVMTERRTYRYEYE